MRSDAERSACYCSRLLFRENRFPLVGMMRKTAVAFRSPSSSTGTPLAVSKLARVVLWMVGALLSFSVMAVSIRELARFGMSIFEILAVRSIVALVVLCALLMFRPELRVHTLPRRMPLNLFRNSVHYASQYLWALALTMLPLATVFALEFTMPAWTALLAAWLLGEKLTPSRIGVVVLGLVGVLVILRPGIASFNPAVILVLLAALGFAVVMISTKKLTMTETTFGIVFWMAVIQLPLSLVGSDLTAFLHLETRHILPAFGVGIAGLTSHYCLSNAFRAGDATMVVPLDFMRIPLIAVVGWAVYGERLDLFVLFGALIIVAGVLWNLRSETVRARPAPP
jgi:drug/metabolite transporter (DMT)-like permease